MNRKRFSNLGLYFASIVFLIMLFSMVLIFLCALVMFRLGYLDHRFNPLMFLAFFLFISTIIGYFLSFWVGKMVLKPIREFSKASHEVSKGNFQIRLKEGSRIEEIHDLSHNFNTMVQELSSIETLRNDFVVNVSHEFKTPIASVEGYATLLQDETLSKNERDTYTKMIIDSSRQLSALSGNILALSKLENQEIILECQTYRLDEQIRQAILLLEKSWNEKNLELDIDLPKILFTGSEQLLMQVWMNLISNAVKFTPENGKITIRMRKAWGNIIVDVTDTGCGMDNEVVHHVFDKFYQGDTARKSEGNGLGLSLVKRIVDLCHGKIEVNSRIGDGSTFSIILPNQK